MEYFASFEALQHGKVVIVVPNFGQRGGALAELRRAE